MNKILSPNAQFIQDYLNNNFIKTKVIEFEIATRTSQEAASAAKCDLAKIAKSILFATKGDKSAVLVIASGPNRVNEKVIAQAVGKKIEKANAEFVKNVTGFAIGGVPSVCHKEKIEHIFIDQDLLNFDTVWSAAGTPHAIFEIKVQDLIKLTDAKIINIKDL